MRSPKPVTPEEATAVWSSIRNPSARSVAKALSLRAGGRRGCRTVSQMWRHNYEIAQTRHA
jgi:hypothetical protein